MNDLSIRVGNLGKQYRIGTAQERHDTLRDAIVATLEGWNVGGVEICEAHEGRVRLQAGGACGLAGVGVDAVAAAEFSG